MGRDLANDWVDESIRIPPFQLQGKLAVPKGADSIVLFAHGSGSSHRSPRNNWVAEALRKRGLGTLLFDLLSPAEAEDRRNVLDIGLLAERLQLATRWLDEVRGATSFRLGYFGASTGAAAALVAAAREKREIGAIVSRGGRPDLAGSALTRVSPPTLLIVGGLDYDVLELNRAALAELTCEKALEVVPGATHLFGESGALEQATELAADWFSKHLALEEES
jgi:pimeloyl-ACP methyl ester carboxylesterase